MSPAERIRAARAVGHRAVTEGVNLKYVEQLRQTLYALADDADELVADRDRWQETAFGFQEDRDRLAARVEELEAWIAKAMETGDSGLLARVVAAESTVTTLREALREAIERVETNSESGAPQSWYDALSESDASHPSSGDNS